MMRRSSLVLLLGMPACLELNPEYVDRNSDTDTNPSGMDTTSTLGSDDSSGSSDSTGDAMGGSSGSALPCGPDGLEPNEGKDEAVDVVMGQSLSSTIHDFTDDDYFAGTFDPGTPTEIFARVLPQTLQSCIYVRCQTAPDPATIQKCSGALSTSENGDPGCCAPGVASMEYACGNSYDVLFYTRVNDPTATECVAYDLEIGKI